MLALDTVWVLRNWKKYKAGAIICMGESSSSGNSPIMSTLEGDVNSESEMRVLTQKQVDE